MNLIEILLSVILGVLVLMLFAAMSIARNLDLVRFLLHYISEPYQKHKIAVSPQSDDD